MVTFCNHFFCRCDYILWAVALARPPHCPTHKRWHFCCIWETSNGKRNKSVTKPFELCSRSTDRLSEPNSEQLYSNAEPMLISWHCCSTALRDPVRSVWIRRRMNKDCCEIRWDAFKFCTEFCYKQIKQRWCRKLEVVMITIPWCCGRKSRKLLHYSFQGSCNLLREKFKHFSVTFKYFTTISSTLKLEKWSNLNVVLNKHLFNILLI